MIEQDTCNIQVVGLNPIGGSHTQCSIAQLVVREAVNFEVLGSSPSGAVDKNSILSYNTSCVKEDASGEQSPTLRN